MATITKVEAKYLLTALDTHIEECAELMLNPAVGKLNRYILARQMENYRSLRNKLEVLLGKGVHNIHVI